MTLCVVAPVLMWWWVWLLFGDGGEDGAGCERCEMRARHAVRPGERLWWRGRCAASQRGEKVIGALAVAKCVVVLRAGPLPC